MPCQIQIRNKTKNTLKVECVILYFVKGKLSKSNVCEVLKFKVNIRWWYSCVLVLAFFVTAKSSWQRTENISIIIYQKRIKLFNTTNVAVLLLYFFNTFRTHTKIFWHLSLVCRFLTYQLTEYGSISFVWCNHETEDWTKVCLHSNY